MDKLKTTMKAVVANGYGSPEILEVKEVPKPRIEPTEVLVKTSVASITRADTLMRAGDPWFARLVLGLFKRKHPIIGTGYAGVVVEVGAQRAGFEVGDSVFGETTTNFSTNAEYIAVGLNDIIMQMPAQISFEEASTMCDGPVTSLNFLKLIGEVKSGQKVLIVGASGSLGSAAIQIAKNLGAEVTGVCSGRNVKYVKSLGADHIINYLEKDFRKLESAYDVIYDTVGAHSFKSCKNALREGGLYMSPVLSMPLLWASLFNREGRKRAKFAATGMAPKDTIRDLLKSLVKMKQLGKLEILIERRYSMDQIREAHIYVESGRKRGNVVLGVAEC